MEKNYKYYIIYKTTNVVNQEYYIGMHCTDILEDKYMGSGKRFRRSLKKYGRENFIREIMFYCNSKNELIELEKNIVNVECINNPKCLNLMEGGRGGFISDEQQKHRSLCGSQARQLKLKNDPDFKKEQSEKISQGVKKAKKEGKINHIPTFKGKKHSEETKGKLRLISMTNVGSKNGSYGTIWVYNNELKLNKKIKKTDIIPEGWLIGTNVAYYKKNLEGRN